MPPLQFFFCAYRNERWRIFYIDYHAWWPRSLYTYYLSRRSILHPNDIEDLTRMCACVSLSDNLRRRGRVSLKSPDFPTPLRCLVLESNALLTRLSNYALYWFVLTVEKWKKMKKKNSISRFYFVCLFATQKEIGKRNDWISPSNANLIGCKLITDLSIFVSTCAYI